MPASSAHLADNPAHASPRLIPAATNEEATSRTAPAPTSGRPSAHPQQQVFSLPVTAPQKSSQSPLSSTTPPPRGAVQDPSLSPVGHRLAYVEEAAQPYAQPARVPGSAHHRRCHPPGGQRRVEGEHGRANRGGEPPRPGHARVTRLSTGAASARSMPHQPTQTRFGLTPNETPGPETLPRGPEARPRQPAQQTTAPAQPQRHELPDRRPEWKSPARRTGTRAGQQAKDPHTADRHTGRPQTDHHSQHHRHSTPPPPTHIHTRHRHPANRNPSVSSEQTSQGPGP